MRYITYIFALFCLGIAHAQDASNKIVLGGAFQMSSFSSSYLEDDQEKYYYSSASIQLQPYVGWQPNGRWMFGLQGGINLRHSTITEVGPIPKKNTSKLTVYSLGVLSRRYFMEGKPLRFFLEPGIRYTRYDHKPDSQLFGPVILYSKELTAYIAPGIRWAIGKHIGLLAKFGTMRYVTGNRKADGAEKPYKISQFDLQMNAETLAIGAEVGF